MNTSDIQPSDLVGIYNDIAISIGVDATIKLYNDFQGQQFVLPKKLYTKEFIIKSIEKDKKEGKVINFRKIARQFGYTERWLRQIINTNKINRKDE